MMNFAPNKGTMDRWNLQMWDPNLWNPDAEDMNEKNDMEYWKQLYPEQTRRIQREVEHQCDLLDYEGSVMYDEYPDRISLTRICESIYNSLLQSGIVGTPSGQPMTEGINIGGSMGSESQTGQILGDMDRRRSQEFTEDEDTMMDGRTVEEEMAGALGYQPIGQVDMMQYGRNDRQDRSLQNLIEVLLFHEMHRRRRRRRRNRSWYFG